MQALRQVLSRTGRSTARRTAASSYARIGDADRYRDAESVAAASATTAALLDNFDARDNCKDVTCLYNPTNWWLEALIESDESLADVAVLHDRRDTFL